MTLLMGRAKRAIPFVIIVICLALPYLLRENPYWLHIMIIVGVNIIMAASLRVIMSAGYINLAHPFFVACGAYTSTLLVMRLDQDFLVGLVSGIVVAVLFALPTGYVFLRVRGVSFFILTLCFLKLFEVGITHFGKDLFGGADGLRGIPPPTLFGLTIDSQTSLYYLALLFVAITIIICWRIEYSRVGKIFKSIRANEDLCQSLGINTLRWKLLAFVISCGLAGMGGVFFAHYIRFISPPDFGIWPCMYYQIYVIIGGSGSVWGPVLGALLLGGLGDIFRGLGPYQMFSYSVTLILIMVFLPEGLVSLPKRIRIRGLKRGIKSHKKPWAK